MQLDHRPLLVGGVACIAQPLAPILAARGFSPGHDVILGVFANTRESQPLKSRNRFSPLIIQRSHLPRTARCNQSKLPGSFRLRSGSASQAYVARVETILTSGVAPHLA